MALPIVLPALEALAAAGGLTLTGAAASKLAESGVLSEAYKNWITNRDAKLAAAKAEQARELLPEKKIIVLPSEPLVLNPEYRTESTPITYMGYKPLLMTETLPPLTGDETIPEAVVGGPGVVIVESETTVPGGPGEPYREDPEDDENWYERLKRKRNEHRREKAEIESKRADAAERRLDAEEARLKMSRDRISADKAYQDFLRSQGRSIPRPSAWQRPVSQGISRFFGFKGPATTNRFYNSPAMGVIEWGVSTSPITIPAGIKINKFVNKSDNTDDIDIEKSSNGRYVIQVE